MQCCPLGTCRIHTSDFTLCDKAVGEDIKDIVRQLHLWPKPICVVSRCARDRASIQLILKEMVFFYKEEGITEAGMR